jgi:AraC-like DNA-binding protein
MSIADGFPGQKLIVLPRPMVRAALQRPGTAHLVVTDCGYFPEARAHGMTRQQGIDQAIVMVCVRGAGWCELGGQRHQVKAGQVVVVPPGAPHAYGADREDPWTLWWLHVTGPDLAELLRTSRLTVATPVRALTDVFRVVSLIEEAVRTLERDPTGRSLLMASGAAWHLLTILSAAPRPGQETSPADRAGEYLREHLRERVSVADLAAMAQLSPSHFAALFRRRFGVPVLRYQTELRMARARELLDTTALTVAEVGREVGYDDPFYFSRQFSAIHGATPRRYRAQHKG